MSGKNVKTNLLDHSAAKVRLLGEYLKRYLGIISNDGYTRKIQIHDLFCGEGQYDNGGEGSPLIILRAVKDAHNFNIARSKPNPIIDCHFNDLDANKVNKVKSIAQNKSLSAPEIGKIDFTTNDYEAEVMRLLATLPNLRNEKAFIFIDPYEYKHIRADQIRNLMSKGSTEVLLWLPTQFMYRFEENGTPKALKDFIGEIVQYESWQPSQNVWDFINQVKNGFQTFLGKEYFIDTFTIQKDPATVFCLFFFTGHIRGFEKMLEAKWEIDDEEGKGWDYTHNSQSLFFVNRTNPLEEKLTALLRGREVYNGEVYEFTLRAGFLPKHATQVFSALQTDNKLVVECTDRSKPRKGAFYINYQCFKDDFQKVKFKLL